MNMVNEIIVTDRRNSNKHRQKIVVNFFFSFSFVYFLSLFDMHGKTVICSILFYFSFLYVILSLFPFFRDEPLTLVLFLLMKHNFFCKGENVREMSYYDDMLPTSFIFSLPLLFFIYIFKHVFSVKLVRINIG